MKFENTEVWGFEHSIRGMRNPLESWSKSDSGYGCQGNDEIGYVSAWSIGKNDLELMQKLIRAGTPHRKFMRQIFVSVDITAPLYWWKEFDTYKVGTTANSTSTMHKLASTPITKECFEMDDFENVKFRDCNVSTKQFWENYFIPYLERLRNYHNKNIELSKEKNMTEQERKRMIIVAKGYWKELIRLLPESWLQTRTITMNYENILNMVEYRKNHKLSEWSESFMNWVKSLPYANDLLFL
jgi:hypothetical protein